MSINLENYNLKRIVSVEKGGIEHVFDIEVDHPDHAFIAQSPDGAIRSFS